MKGELIRRVACAAKFWIYWMFTFLSLSFFTFYGQMTVAISPNVQASPCISVVAQHDTGIHKTLEATVAIKAFIIYRGSVFKTFPGQDLSIAVI